MDPLFSVIDTSDKSDSEYIEYCWPNKIDEMARQSDKMTFDQYKASKLLLFLNKEAPFIGDIQLELNSGIKSGFFCSNTYCDVTPKVLVFDQDSEISSVSAYTCSIGPGPSAADSQNPDRSICQLEIEMDNGKTEVDGQKLSKPMERVTQTIPAGRRVVGIYGKSKRADVKANENQFVELGFIVLRKQNE